VIDRCPSRPAGGRLVRPEKDQHVGKLDDLNIVRADGHRGPAKRIHEEFLLRRQVCRVQVVMAVRDRTFPRGLELREGG
jgi:hypothetical protein